MRGVGILAATLILATLDVEARATDTSEPLPPSPFHLTYEKFTLPNGLEVILHPDARLPLVAVNLWYHVGPVNEPPGRSGFAHLFEHLMFEGSKYAGSNFDYLLESIGATRGNGTTSWDRTNYFETVPREYLELALWLESDRMGFLMDALDEGRLDVQRDVVKNERRQRYENAPYGPSELAMYDLLFPSGHPYHGAIIGSMDDLSRATLNDVAKYFERYYAPSNATLTLAGDIDVKTTRGLVEKYFGTLRSRPRLAKTGTGRPIQPLEAPRRLIVPEVVPVPRITRAWLTPPAFTPDDVVLTIVAEVLGGGKAARLYRELVVDARLCSDLNVWLDSNAVTSVFSIEATVQSGRTSAEVERALEGALEAFGESGPTIAELERAKRRVEVATLSSLQLLDGSGGETGRAGTLQRLNHYLGDPGRLPREMARLRSVTVEEVQRAVSAHLGPIAATVVTEPSGGTP
jgi:zinc protease